MLDLPIDDINSYQLKRVYRGTLTNVVIQYELISKPIGTVNNIKVNSPDNFIHVITQNFISTDLQNRPECVSTINFEYLFNETSYRSPTEILKREGFIYGTRGIHYSFSMLNVPVGIHSLNANAWKLDSKPYSENVYFNMDHRLVSTPGSVVIFVYEK